MFATASPAAVPITNAAQAQPASNDPAQAQAPTGTSPEVALAADALSTVAQFMAESRVLEEMAAAYMAADELARAEQAEADEAARQKAALSMQAFPEQWGMSQFWNDESTARVLAEECVRQARGGPIVLISSPSVFLALKKMGVRNRLLLLEYDTRFAVFPEFRAYDFNRPLSVGGMSPRQLAHVNAAVVLLDPPYVKPDCLARTAETARAVSGPDTKVIACTGWVVRDTAAAALGTHMARFRPGHNGGLATPFRTYVNYAAEGAFGPDPDPEDGDNDGTAFAGNGGVATD